jgi:hypothetical protein
VADSPVTWLGRLSAALRERRLRAQQDSVHTRLMQVCVRLDEARRYVDRDRAAERAYIDKLIQKIRTGREKTEQMADLVRASLVGQSLLQAELTVAQAMDALASDFGDLGDS